MNPSDLIHHDHTPGKAPGTDEKSYKGHERCMSWYFECFHNDNDLILGQLTDAQFMPDMVYMISAHTPNSIIGFIALDKRKSIVFMHRQIHFCIFKPCIYPSHTIEYIRSFPRHSEHGTRGAVRARGRKSNFDCFQQDVANGATELTDLYQKHPNMFKKYPRMVLRSVNQHLTEDNQCCLYDIMKFTFPPKADPDQDSVFQSAIDNIHTIHSQNYDSDNISVLTSHSHGKPK
jgi:hypothetical protein